MVLDGLVILIYLCGVSYIGIYAAKFEKSPDDFFLGGRKQPWWAVSISIYATSLSALTFIGVPGAAFAEDFHYLQLVIGDLFGRIGITYLFLGPYYKNRITTVYQFLGIRFGQRSQDAGTGFFIITRLLASGVRLAGCALAFSILFEIPPILSVIFIALVALFYTFLGGIKAVIWTDTLQFLIFIGGAITALLFIFFSLPNGWSDFIDTGQFNNKFKVFHFSLSAESPDYWLNLSNSKSFLAGTLFGFISTFAALGTDQDLVQRMLTCKNVRGSQKALLASALLNLPITLLFLSVGAGLFVYFEFYPELTVQHFVSQNQTDKIFPYFIKTVLSSGFRGLLIAGLLAAAMSSLDSALNALASTAYVDIYKRYIRSKTEEMKALTISRIFIVFFTFSLIGIAIAFVQTDSILWLGFRVVGYTYGGLLGIFLLAVLTKNRGHDLMNMIAMITSVVFVIFLTAEKIGVLQSVRKILLQPFGIEHLAWPWAILIGTVWTFGISVLFRTKIPFRIQHVSQKESKKVH